MTTNKYQEALDSVFNAYENEVLTANYAGTQFRITDFIDEDTINVIQRILKAGARASELGVSFDELLSSHSEGRILPKLPDGYIFSCTETQNGYSTIITNENYFCNGEKYKDVHISAGRTPAEAMQNAIDKIGGNQ